MRLLDKKSTTPYPLYSTTLNGIDELIELEYPSKYFVLLLAADFSKMENEKITEIAKKLISKGLLYICAWGPDCERAHDSFDLAKVIWEEDNDKKRHAMSTWHSDESLEEALWFCVFNAIVDDEFWNECSTIVVAINEENWADIIENSLSDVSAFNDKMVKG